MAIQLNSLELLKRKPRELKKRKEKEGSKIHQRMSGLLAVQYSASFILENLINEKMCITFFLKRHCSALINSTMMYNVVKSGFTELLRISELFYVSQNLNFCTNLQKDYLSCSEFFGKVESLFKPK